MNVCFFVNLQQKQFARMSKVFPLADVLDFKVDADMYRMVIGVTELVCGIILAMIPGNCNDKLHSLHAVILSNCSEVFCN